MYTGASADNLLGSSHGGFSCAASSPSTPQSAKSEYHMRPTFSYFCLYNPFGRHHSQATPRLAGHRRTSDSVKGAIFVSVNVPTSVFNSATNSVPGPYLEAEVDTVDLLPEDLVGKDIFEGVLWIWRHERMLTGVETPSLVTDTVPFRLIRPSRVTRPVVLAEFRHLSRVTAPLAEDLWWIRKMDFLKCIYGCGLC